VGLIVVGMQRHGYRVWITCLDDHWRPRFDTHPMISDDGYGVAATPWGAVQRASWMVMRRASAMRASASNSARGGKQTGTGTEGPSATGC
jgi:hypothetical protein